MFNLNKLWVKFLFLLCLSSIQATVYAINSMTEALIEETGENITFFYQNPSQESFLKIQKNLMALKDKVPVNNLMTIIIEAKFISDYYNWPLQADFFPDYIEELNHPDSKIVKIIQDDKEVSPGKLDIWWGQFFATGKPEYVRKVFNQAILLEEVKKAKENGDVNQLLISSAADWSFKSNCTQHALIREFALKWQQESALTKPAKELLSACIHALD